MLRLKNRVRGWNGTRQDPLQDARWALDRIRRTLPGLPVVVVGHSMGGRVALHLNGEPDVIGVAALAPWIESDVRQARPGAAVLLMHGSNDRITDPRRTAVLARAFAERRVDLRYVRVEGGSHAMLKDARLWHDVGGRLRHGRAARPSPNQLTTPPAASRPAHHSMALR